jgi:hypothetical protein
MFAALDEGAFAEPIRDVPPPFPCAAIDAPLRTKLIAGTSLSVRLAVPMRGGPSRCFRPPFFH